LRARLAIVTGLFVVLEGAAALLMLVGSVHGASTLSLAAPVYFVVAVTATWWAARRYARMSLLLGTGGLMLAGAPGVIALFDRIDQFQYDRRIAATRVTDVHDEPILSATGRPIGVRVSYKVSVPSRGYFAITPSLYGVGPRNERLPLGAARWMIDGSTEPKQFEPGKENVMVVELYPTILFFRRDERCLSTTQIPPLPEGSSPAPLRIAISESSYGNTYHGGHEESTHGSYDVADLYRGVLAEGLSPCT
jgi:hypothetical protein